jgi:cobalt/nickel transport system permease protein
MAFSSSQLDRYIEGASPIHRADARVKLVLTLGCVLALALLPVGSWLAMAAVAILLWVAIFQAQVGPGTILRRSFVALPFALAAATLIFSRHGAALFTLALGPLRLVATDAGLLAFVSVVLKSWLSVQAALLLMATTHFTAVLQALRALRLPAVLVAILSFAYRYLFVLTEEAHRMLRARECRSAEAAGRVAGRSLAWRAGVVARWRAPCSCAPTSAASGSTWPCSRGATTASCAAWASARWARPSWACCLSAGPHWPRSPCLRTSSEP